MKFIPNYPKHKLLENVPDMLHWDKALQWIQEGQKLIQKIPVDPIFEEEIISLEWNEVAQDKDPSFGFYPLENWRKFVLSVYFADIASYVQPVDQVNFERLLFVMHAFPQGFRTWWIKLTNGFFWPVGYSGWYPMLETTFELFEKHPQKLKDRMVVPNTSLNGQKPYLYLFNFSAAPEVKASGLTKFLIKKFVEDIHAQHAAGLSCITVSEDGKRIANRFGMHHTGDLNLNGSLEGVYVKRF